MAWAKAFQEGPPPDWLPAADWEIVRGICWPWNINPYFIAAIGWHETHWGQLGAGRNGFHLGVSVYPPHYGLDQFRGVQAQVAWAAERVNLYLPDPVDQAAVIEFNRATGYSESPESWGASVWAIFDQLMRGYATGPGSPCPTGPTPEEIGGAVGEAIGGFFGKLTEPPPEGSGGIVGWISRNIIQPLGALFGGAEDVLSHIFFFIRWAFDRIVWFFKEAWDGIHWFFDNVWGAVFWLFDTVWGGVSWLFTTAWHGVYWFFTRAWGWIQWLFDTARSLVDFLWHTARDGIVWLFKTVWGAVYWLFNNAWAAVVWFFDHLWDAAYWLFTFAWQSVVWLFSSVWDAVYWLFNNAWAAVVWFFDRLWDAAYWFFNQIWAAVFWVFSEVWSLVYAFFSNPLKFLAGVLTTVIKMVLAPVLWVLIEGLELIAGSWDPPANPDYMERARGDDGAQD